MCSCFEFNLESLIKLKWTVFDITIRATFKADTVQRVLAANLKFKFLSLFKLVLSLYQF